MSKDSLLCFCKHPEPGFVKTRLSRELGKDFVASLYKNLIENLLKEICNGKFNAALYCYPTTKHPFFDYCQIKFQVTLHNQEGHDLGSRMFNAISESLNNSTSVILIGSDCPQIDSAYINLAFQKLKSGHDIVLGPAFDGGYALIGANKINREIFNNIPWSTNRVLQITQDKITSLGWSYACLSTVRDIDELSDYEFYIQNSEFKKIIA